MSCFGVIRIWDWSQKGLLVVDDSWLYCGVTTQRDHLKGGTVLEIGNFGTLNLCFVGFYLLITYLVSFMIFISYFKVIFF